MTYSHKYATIYTLASFLELIVLFHRAPKKEGNCMHYIQITKSQTATLSSLIQEAAKYASEIAELARDCAEDDVQYAEIVTMKRQISVYERYRTNVQHEIDLILDSLRENIRFAKNDIATLPDDDDLLFATISDEDYDYLSSHIFRSAQEADKVAALDRKLQSSCSHTIRMTTQERLDLHRDEQNEYEYAIRMKLSELQSAFQTAKPKSDL